MEMNWTRLLLIVPEWLLDSSRVANSSDKCVNAFI